MLIYLDTTISKQAKLQLKDGNIVIAEIEGEDALVLVEKLLKEAGVNINQIKEIKINEGPGSYTGLKVAAAIANTFNWVQGKEGLINPKYS